MRVRAEPCVFFISGVSASEEYEIVNRQESKRKKGPTEKLAGDGFFISGSGLYRVLNFESVDLVYSERDEKVFNIFMCLAMLSPLRNFVLNFRERCGNIMECNIMSRFVKFVDAVIGGKRCDIDHLLVDCETLEYGEIYSEFLDGIHGEMCARYTFEINDWSTFSKEKVPRFKQIHQEYSPVAEIFHGKAIFSDREDSGFFFDRIKLTFCNILTARKAIDTSLETGRYKIIEVPPILTLVVAGTGRISISGSETLIIRDLLYILSAFIVEDGDLNCCYVKNSETWCRYERNGMTCLPEIEDICGSPSILFYVRKE